MTELIVKFGESYVEARNSTMTWFFCSLGRHTSYDAIRAVVNGDEPSPTYICDGCLTTSAIKIASYRKRQSNEEARLTNSGSGSNRA
jgi:hypothetical protein